MGRPETPVGTGLRRSVEAPPVRVVNRAGGWGERTYRPRGRGRSADPRFSGAGGNRIDHRIVGAVLASCSGVATVSSIPMRVDSAGDARAAARADRALAHFRRQALPEPAVSAAGALPYPRLQTVGDGATAFRCAPEAPRGGVPHGVVSVAGPDDRVCDRAGACHGCRPRTLIARSRPRGRWSSGIGHVANEEPSLQRQTLAEA